MDQQQMRSLIDQHLKAEMAGDSLAAVAMYTPDVTHDVVGWPTGPVRGPAAAQEFYDELIALFANQEMRVTRELFGEDFCVVEHDCVALVNGEFMGIPGNGKRVTFRLLHVWEFAEDAISRENVWLDGGAIAAQLAA